MKKSLQPCFVGSQFNNWRVIEILPVPHKGHHKALCECICGKQQAVSIHKLRYELSKGCKSCSNKRKSHSDYKSREYGIYRDMKQRCLNSKNKAFCNYGARGITICQRWLDSYSNFLEDMGRSPTLAHTLDRIDVNGNYTPENCRWALRKEQNRNRRNTIYVTYEGHEYDLATLCDTLSVKYSVVKERLVLGHTIEDALTAPIKNRKPITINGVTKTSAGWESAEGCTISRTTIEQRIKSGWDPFTAVFTPRRHKSHGKSKEEKD